MVWDFSETNPIEDSAGSFLGVLEWAAKALIFTPAKFSRSATQGDAQSQKISSLKVVSTDPPYYDNIGYADLSDFFYVWLRKVPRPVFPSLLATIAVPKAEELVATPYRHGSKEKAESFFLNGMTQAMRGLAEQAHPGIPFRFTTHSNSRRRTTILEHTAQLLGYLKSIRVEHGLLINFGSYKFEIKKYVLTNS